MRFRSVILLYLSLETIKVKQERKRELFKNQEMLDEVKGTFLQLLIISYLYLIEDKETEFKSHG